MCAYERDYRRTQTRTRHRVDAPLLFLLDLSARSRISAVQFPPPFTPVSFIQAVISATFNSALSLHHLPIFNLLSDFVFFVFCFFLRDN